MYVTYGIDYPHRPYIIDFPSVCTCAVVCLRYPTSNALVSGSRRHCPRAVLLHCETSWDPTRRRNRSSILGFGSSCRFRALTESLWLVRLSSAAHIIIDFPSVCTCAVVCLRYPTSNALVSGSRRHCPRAVLLHCETSWDPTRRRNRSSILGFGSSCRFRALTESLWLVRLSSAAHIIIDFPSVPPTRVFPLPKSGLPYSQHAGPDTGSRAQEP